MTDPFEALRAPITPADPHPAFTARLRARIERALALPRGVVVSAALPETQTAAPTGAAVPYLAVRDARAAIDWYAGVFDARVVGEPIVMPDGRIGHAELALAGGSLYLADEHPEIGVAAPRPGEASVSLMLNVADADETRARAMAAGATGDREPYDAYGERNAWIVDPFGHRWGLQSPLRSPQSAATPSYRHGDVGYVSLWVPDADRAKRFYAAVLGWTFAGGGTIVEGATPSTGILGNQPSSTLFCCYAVDDVADAVERIRAAGGDAAEPRREPYGLVADCTDDLGTRFAVYEQPSDQIGERPPANGRRSGDLSYLTLQVTDAQRAKTFYGDVLGWRFSPGHVADGWQVEDTAPMIGLWGGGTQATGVPMWRVNDIAAALERVRALGGTATDAERQPYGLSSECVDDQGSRFYLGEH